MLSGQMLTLATLASVIFGVIVGLILRTTSTAKWSARDIMYMHFAGELFLRMLKCLMLPLIMSSLIAAIGTLNLKASGRIGARAITYYMITTFMAVILGIILVIAIRPGHDRHAISTLNLTHTHGSPVNSKFRNTTTVDTMLDLVRNMFPPNIVQACLEQLQTVLTPPPFNSSELTFYHRPSHSSSLRSLDLSVQVTISISIRLVSPMRKAWT